MRSRGGFGEARGDFRPLAATTARVMILTAAACAWRGFARGLQAEQMADRVDEVGAVHRVEMEIGDAAIDEIEHLLGRHGGGDQPARLQVARPARRSARASQPGSLAPARAAKLRDLLEILHRDDAGHDRDVDAGALARDRRKRK